MYVPNYTGMYMYNLKLKLILLKLTNFAPFKL